MKEMKQALRQVLDNICKPLARIHHYGHPYQKHTKNRYKELFKGMAQEHQMVTFCNLFHAPRNVNLLKHGMSVGSFNIVVLKDALVLTLHPVNINLS